MGKDIAIQVSNLSKTFRIPHEKITTLRGAFVNAFKSNSYEEFKALDDVSFEVKKGEFFGIIGRNGSGKSTLLKILAGIYQPDKVHPVKSSLWRGAKQFNGVKINGLISPFLELGIGFNPELSGRDNVYLNASVLGLSKKQIDEKFDDIVEFSELRRFIDQKVKNFSSGMQVRLMFSVAIHANREILLMDEVLAVGDVNFQSKCLEEFGKYKDMGKTVVLVTHDIGTVQRYCDRAMLLRNGKIEMIGNSEEVGNKYIYQNMSDEENRMIEEEERKEMQNRKKIGNQNELEEIEIRKLGERRKIARITKIEFLDKNGDRKNVFNTGDDISARVYFEQNKEMEELNFGLTLHNMENNYLFGINSFIDKIDIESCKKNNYFQINFFGMPFKTNSYFVKVGLYGQNESKNYDLVEKSGLFKIISGSKTHGAVEVKYNWS